MGHVCWYAMHGKGWSASLRSAASARSARSCRSELAARGALAAVLAALSGGCTAGDPLGLAPLGSGSLAPVGAGAPTRAAIRCESGALAHSWARPRGLVYACAEGALPARERPDVWRGSGIAFYKLAPDAPGPQRIRDAASQAHDVEYWVDGNRLVWELRSFDPRTASAARFARQTLAIDGTSLAPAVELLMQPVAADPRRVDELLGQLRAASSAPPERLAALLFELRNHGLREPRQLADQLDAVGRSWNSQGPAADLLAQVLLELRLAQRAGAASGSLNQR
jgi:hypothetical protein